MSLTSFYSALTGLTNNALAINVVGNNLANINTTAYKSEKTVFAELLGGLASTTASNGNPVQIGLGSTIAGVTPQLTQGSVAYTGRSTDAAISGNGFFVVEIPGGGNGFTRAGSFGLTSAGELINSEGFKLLGYPAANGVINPSGVLAPIVIEKGGSMPPKATADISINANLDAQAAAGTVFSTSVQIYDSLGATHTVTFNFTKTNAGYDWTATLPAVELGGTATATPVQVGSGSMTFDSNGVLTAPTTNPTLAIAGFTNKAANMTVNFDILDAQGKPRFTSYGADSSSSQITQNGYSSSQLSDISIDNNGVVMGLYDNGQSQPIAQLALANFPNVEGLEKFKGSTFIAFGNSGEPSIGTAGTGGRGSISGGSLEQSNVDIAQEFTSLIVAQRGYQANSRIITTTDELYQDAINIKR